MPSKPIKNKQVFSFKKGELRRLDSIYMVNGLCCYTGGAWNPWWEPVNDTGSSGNVAEEKDATHSSGEIVRITRDITIEIIER
jgi:hypothetical protein